MICYRIKESVFLHAHGQLNGLPRVLVEYHLSRCPGCRAQSESWAAERTCWREALTSHPGLNGSADAARRTVAERIRSEAQGPAPRSRFSPAQRRWILVLGA